MKRSQSIRSQDRYYDTSITATLNRQWDELADYIIMHNLDRTDDEIVALIREKNGCKNAAWVRARRGLFAPRPSV